MRLVVGILLIALGLWALAANVISLIERDRMIRRASQVQTEEVQANVYYVVSTGWLTYLTSLGIPAIMLTGGGLLIRDSRWLIPQS